MTDSRPSACHPVQEHLVSQLIIAATNKAQTKLQIWHHRLFLPMIFLVQVSYDLLQKGVQTEVHFCLFEQLDEVHMVRHQLPQISHLLKHFGEELEGVGVVHLQLQLQGVQHRFLKIFDGFDIQ